MFGVGVPELIVLIALIVLAVVVIARLSRRR
jgi:hypothetical protein